MMTSVVETTNILQAADDMVAWSKKILKAAPLTETQRSDMIAVRDAALNFRKLANENYNTILSGSDNSELKHLRHDLRNFLNIIVGFSRIIVRELPDNLLLHLVTVRNIHTTGNELMSRVNEIR